MTPFFPLGLTSDVPSYVFTGSGPNIFLYNKDGLFHSSDLGETFGQMKTNDGAISPPNLKYADGKNIISYSNGSRLNFSTDGGLTYSSKDLNTAFPIPVVNSATFESGSIYVGGLNGTLAKTRSKVSLDRAIALK